MGFPIRTEENSESEEKEEKELHAFQHSLHARDAKQDQRDGVTENQAGAGDRFGRSLCSAVVLANAAMRGTGSRTGNGDEQ